jgi:ribonuclease BN (tRNA processing enzyme)
MESSSSPPSWRTRGVKKQKGKDVLYSIDVLTDGSEGTGDGTLFLSVWKKNTASVKKHPTNDDDDDHGSNHIANDDDDDDENDDWYTAAPAARYCLSGAMNADATSRLAADQRFKLGTTLRAIFCAPSQSQQQLAPEENWNENSSQRNSSSSFWWGITPLHLALRKAGAASVHVIVADPPPSSLTNSKTTTGQQQQGKASGDDDTTTTDILEKVIALTEGRSLYPVVHICRVPQIDESTSSHAARIPTPWWKVYQDEYILVHARRMMMTRKSIASSAASSSSAAVLFLYTFISQKQQRGAAPQNGDKNDTTGFTSFLVSSPQDCSVRELEKIMHQLLVKNEHKNNNNNAMRLPVVSPIKLGVQDETQINNTNNTNEIPIQCRFAIGLKPSFSIPTSMNTQDRLKMNKSASSDSSSGSASLTSDDDDDDTSNDDSSSSSSSSSSDSVYGGENHVYWTQPSPSAADPSLLVRARRQGIEWNEELPEFFSWNMSHSRCSSDNNQYEDYLQTGNRLQTGTSLVFTVNQNEKPFIVDRMADTILRVQHSKSDIHADAASASKSESDIPRQKWPHRLLDFLKSPLVVTDANGSSTDPLRTDVDDENEIDLDDDDDDSEKRVNDMENRSKDKSNSHDVVKLLVLGTGCASPSAYRGASGYALLFPKILAPTAAAAAPEAAKEAAVNLHHHHPEWAMVVEAGEGFVTQWHRHATMSIGKIRFIWVSHAHWDHYGGLAPLLVAIAKARHAHYHGKTSSMQNGHQSKRPRRDTCTANSFTPLSASSSSYLEQPLDHDPPWVMAPRKVLNFLELVLPSVKSHNGQCRRYYRGVPMDEQSNNSPRRRAPTVRPSDHCPSDAFDELNKRFGRPIAFWENIQVDHCKSAFGFVAGLRRNVDAASTAVPTNGDSPNDDPFIFAFSGDTRPCQRFVRVCQACVHSGCYACGDSPRGNHVHFLLHEATFDQEELEMAIAKKHSTIREALQVARNVKANRVLLTHFSQRYNIDSLFNNAFDATESGKGSTSLPANATKVGVALDGMLVPLFRYQLE